MSTENVQAAASTAAGDNQNTDDQTLNQDASTENSSTSTADAAAQEEAERKKRESGVSKRIDELTRKRHDAERERDYWREQAMRNNQQAKPQQEDKPEPQKALKPEDFGNYEEYLEAVAERKAEDAFNRRISEQQQKDSERQQAQRQQELRSSAESKFAEARERYEDFDDVVNDPRLPFTPVMADAIAESEMAGDLAYHLGKNPKEVARIAALSPTAQIRELGRIEERLATKPKDVNKPVSTTTPVRSSGGQFQKDPSKMTDGEWYKADKESRKK